MSVLSRAERQYARAVKNAMLGRNIRAGRQLRSTDALLNMAELQGDSGSRPSRSSEAERPEREERSNLARRSARGPLSKKKRDASAKAAYDAVMAAQRNTVNPKERIAQIDAELADMDAAEAAEKASAERDFVNALISYNTPKSAGLLDDLSVFGDDRADVPIDRRPLVGPSPDISYLQPEAAEDRLIQERLRNIQFPFSDAEIQAGQDEYDAQQRTPERDFAAEDEERELAEIIANLDVDVEESLPEEELISEEDFRRAMAAGGETRERMLRLIAAQEGDSDALAALRDASTRRAIGRANLPSFIPRF